MTLQDDYKDILRFLDAENVKYILVGAYAMAAHGFVRASMDIDIFILADAVNSAAVYKAWAQSEILALDNLKIRTLSLEHLIKNKKASGRPKDKVDVLTLEEYKKNGG